MKKSRGYQYNFSQILPDAMYDRESREKKARTMVAVLKDFIQTDCQSLKAIDIGCSTGIITNYLSKYFGKVIGIDIDKNAVEFAMHNFHKNNLEFTLCDSMDIKYPENTFDIAICAHVYEHVPDSGRLMEEIYRVLKPEGWCYFAAGNRLNVIEPHYGLPLLSWLPRPLAHRYMQLTGKGDCYYEKHCSLGGLQRLVGAFRRIDYTKKIIADPAAFYADYMLPAGSAKAAIARLTARYAYWLLPTYIWMLQKP
jgi:ubiquinone/menaquinone biosynthesis C-methylase UbiE